MLDMKQKEGSENNFSDEDERVELTFKGNKSPLKNSEFSFFIYENVFIFL